MRICLCIDKLNNGGAERVISTLANQFSLLGHQISLIETSTGKWDCFYSVRKEINHIYLLEHTTKKGNFAKIKALKQCLKTIDPQIIISFKYQTNINVYLANLRLRIPHIVSERNNPYVYDIGISSKLFKKYVFRHASGCVFQTDDARKFYFKKSKDNITIINNPIHLTTRPERQNIERTRTILYVGRLDEQKNVKMLIDAFNKLIRIHDDFSLKIYGIGNLEQDLKTYVSTLDCRDKVLFMGTSRTWHQDEMSSMLFVLPSNYEGMPNSLMEAMALQIPCISTDCPIGGPKALIQNGFNGILVPCGDVGALADQMVDLIKNDRKREAIAANNKNMIIDCSEESIAKQWLEFVDKILRK